MAEETIQPVEQRTVEFHGDELVAVRAEDGTIWIPIRRVCEALGVTYQGQLERVRRDPVLSDALGSVSVTLTDGRTYEMNCLPLKFVRGWLFGINANRVKEEIREKLIQYQREVIEIIDRAFGRNMPEVDVDDAILEAMRENARQQLQLWETIIAEKRRLRATEELVQEHDDRLMAHERLLWEYDGALKEAFADLSDLRQRQSQLLARFSDVTRLLPAPSDTINPGQKAAIKELVDDIVAAAQERGIRLGQGRNDYPAVWGAFKQRFDLAKYDELTVAQYDEALGWLKAWLDRIRAS
ncbi:MAG: hypothetical protein M3220_22540 [Chloroflexota bacterium]|nr:hypothetical protein [Chloroflexota bacterium]